MRYAIVQILFVIVLFNPLNGTSQTTSDSTKAMHYFKVFQKYEYIDSSKARIYSDSCLFYAYSSNIDDLKGRAHQFKGWYYQDCSRFKEANTEFYTSLSFLKACGNEQGVADAYGNLGNSYLDMEEYLKSLDYQLLSLAANDHIIKNKPVKEELAWAEEGRTFALHNIAAIYQKIELYDEALKYELESIEHELETDNEIGAAISYNTLGQIYEAKGMLDSAIFYIQKALDIYKIHDYPFGLAASLQLYASIDGSGLSPSDKKQMFEEALALRRGMGDADGETRALIQIGETQFESLSTDSLSALVESINILIKENDLNSLNEKYFRLYSKYSSRIGKYDSAYFALENFLELKALSDEQKRTRDLIARDIAHRLQSAYEQDSLEIENGFAVERLESSKQLSRTQNIVYLSVIGVLILVVTLVFIVNGSRRRKRMNEVLVNSNQLIQEQKNQVEEKSKAISDSIIYAKRLQQAILPKASQVNEHLPDSFLFFKPKDVVSGDFHWFETKGDIVFIAAADCTGHGVPGAMVSVVCSNALNRSVNLSGILDPSKILDNTRESVIATFAKSGGDVSDGMDIALCAIKGNKLTFAGANNPLWIVRKNDLIDEEAGNVLKADKVSLVEIKGDKRPIGQYADMEPFHQHEVELYSGDIIYIFSDGFPDQFGGPKGKKFKYAPFKRELLCINHLSMEEQCVHLEKVFDEWKGDLEQVDDICVIGFKWA